MTIVPSPSFSSFSAEAYGLGLTQELISAAAAVWAYTNPPRTLTSPCCPCSLGILMLLHVSDNQNNCLRAPASPLWILSEKWYSDPYFWFISQIEKWEECGKRIRNTPSSMLNKTSISLVHRLSSDFHKNPRNFAIDLSRVQTWKPTLPRFLYASCDTSISTEESKSQVGYAENRTEMKYT